MDFKRADLTLPEKNLFKYTFPDSKVYPLHLERLSKKYFLFAKYTAIKIFLAQSFHSKYLYFLTLKAKIIFPNIKQQTTN